MHSERGKKTRQAEEEVGRQHQGVDRPGVRPVPEGSGEQGKMEKTGCKIICGSLMTLTAKGLMMMMIITSQVPPYVQQNTLALAAGMVVVAFSSLVRIWGEGLTFHSLFVCCCFFLKWRSARAHKSHFLRPGTVHSGSAR